MILSTLVGFFISLIFSKETTLSIDLVLCTCIRDFVFFAHACICSVVKGLKFSIDFIFVSLLAIKLVVHFLDQKIKITSSFVVVAANVDQLKRWPRSPPLERP